MDESDDPESFVRMSAPDRPDKQEAPFQRWGGVIASIILVWVVGCPVSTFFGLMYQQWKYQSPRNIYWDGVAVMLIGWLTIGIAFSVYFIARAKRSKRH